MLQEHVDMGAGDFNGAAWRSSSGSDRRPIRPIEEAFANTSLPVPPGSQPLWGLGGVPGEWADVCGFRKSPGSEAEWQVRIHGAFISWGLQRRIKAAITKFGSIFFTSMPDERAPRYNQSQLLHQNENFTIRQQRMEESPLKKATIRSCYWSSV